MVSNRLNKSGAFTLLTMGSTAKHILKQAQTREELDTILDVIWAANYTPYDPFAQLFFPVLGFLQADREAALAESKQRFWNNHQSDPSSHWYYVVDTATALTVGCAQWQISKANPFPNGRGVLTAPWWPEGEHREFCEAVLEQVYKPRARWMQRPHLALNWMAVHPAHRRLGIGSLLMTAGISRAHDLDLECWMEATAMGKPLYEKFGFRSLFKVAFDTEKANASDVWRKCEHEMTPHAFFAMWRPRGGVWTVGGKDVEMPWEAR
ncbi:hypothetical protein BDV95DRAFT_674137 [Massariosphaeria phaeospora]|uniref:N-acetyltransferase domain-containing protein n=1 Tax=Massariosphaeria phaeospora TaxID=100035 RepID=A0A7C8IED9_9PLEO|nr:hypothetical protein BDV95DRAFT_674137 [Massariosphaeria phaeospora]